MYFSKSLGDKRVFTKTRSLYVMNYCQTRQPQDTRKPNILCSVKTWHIKESVGVLGESTFSRKVTRIYKTDGYHYFKSGNIPKTEGGQILPHLCDSLMISTKFDCHKKRLCWSESILQVACPCLPPTTILRHVMVQRLLTLP